MIEIRNGIAVHQFEYRPFEREREVSDGKQLQIELARTSALMALAIAMSRMPGKRGNLEKLTVVAKDRNASLENLREISDRLRPINAAMGGMRTEHRSVLFSNVQTRALGGSSRIVTFIASTDGLDRHGTKVMPMGINTDNYGNNPIILFGHDGYGGFFSTPDPKNIIGKAAALRKSEKRLEVDIAFLDAETNPTADMVYRMVRAGAVNTVSIGFIPREVRTEVDAAQNEIPVIVRSELLEISVVPIPSNPEALATGNRSKHAVGQSHLY